MTARLSAFVAFHERALMLTAASVVAGEMKMPLRDLLLVRHAQAVEARRRAMYLIRTLHEIELTTIGDFFGVTKQAAAKAVSEISMRRDEGKPLDLWLDDVGDMLDPDGEPLEVARARENLLARAS